MATAKSVATVIQEIEFWLRLATFLHDPLKYALLRVLHNTSNDPTYVGLPDDPHKLYNELKLNLNKITNLVKRGALQQDQVDLLLPPNDNKTDSSKFDVTLIAVLIRNFTTLKPPLNGWKDKNPPAHDQSKAAAVIRGREWRNYVHHTEPSKIDKVEFNKKWAEGVQIITILGYQFDANGLKTISLDPKHQLVLQSLFSYFSFLQAKYDSLEAKHDNLDTKHDSLETKHDNLEAKHVSLETKHSTLESKHESLEEQHTKLLSGLMQQCNKIAVEVQQLQNQERKNDFTIDSGSNCTINVLEYISEHLGEQEGDDLLVQLNIKPGGNLADKLKTTKWKAIKTELEMLGKRSIVNDIQKKFLITRGLQTASNKLREQYKIELIECLTEQPLSSLETDNQYALREDVYIDLIVLPSAIVERESSNSDRDCLMEQDLYDKSSSKQAFDMIIDPEDDLIIIRGVAGIGKSTLLEMFTLKWAKKELHGCSSSFDFVFKFTCRELNQILDQFQTLEDLFKQQYPDIFNNISFEDLNEVSDRVLVIVDGLDELKDIYRMDSVKAPLIPETDFLKVIYELINTKWMKHHKTIICGRPKACEFVKSQLTAIKLKTIEVCGFNYQNVGKYIVNFFGKDKNKAAKVKNIVKSSKNLKIMSTVPVFLWVICHVYNEDLIENPINTNTELYFYTCLVFIRNHFQGSARNYWNLSDIVGDKVIMHAIYSLMVLSVKTYMQNQVLFTDIDINKLNCPVHLEQTGFIIKYSRSNLNKAIYQFRHLILQEFFCGFYLCITKGISPFLQNRELSSCLPTIVGIYRMKRQGHELFLQYYKTLEAIDYKMSSFFTKIGTPLRSLTFRSFMKKNSREFLKLPQCMVDGQHLYIDDTAECREFLDLFKESDSDIDAPKFIAANVDIAIYKDFRNIINLLNKLTIQKIRFRFQFNGNFEKDFAQDGILDDDILTLFSMTASQSMKTIVTIRTYSPYSGKGSYIFFSAEKLYISLEWPFTLSVLPDVIKNNTNEFYIGIEKTSDDEPSVHLVQETAKYAVTHYKDIYLTCYPSRADQLDGHSSTDHNFIPLLLQKCEVHNRYIIHIIDYWKFLDCIS